MKVLWHSNAPWSTTGYGSQTALWTPRLRDMGHDVAISAFWGLAGKVLDWDGIKVYPADEEWGNQWLPAYAAHHGDGDPGNCLVLTLMDVWVLTAPTLSALRMASWCPVDHDPVPPRVTEFFTRTGAAPIAMSRFGEEKLREAGLDPLYVPHGIDTDILRPVPKRDVRHAMGIDEDAFVVGMVAANKGNSPPRKAFPQVFEAFKAFKQDHPEAVLYLHTMRSNLQNGLDLPTLARQVGLEEGDVLFTPPFELQMGVEYEKMAWVYSNMDVLVSPSYGEGFGIPIVEAQACGVPVIVNDFSAMSELCASGWKTTGERWYDMSQGAWYQSPAVASILDCLHQSHEERGSEKRSEEAVAFALGYSLDVVQEFHWAPVLEALDERLMQTPQVVSAPNPPGLNRAQRRAAKRKAAA